MKIFETNKSFPLLKTEGITRTEEGKSLLKYVYRSDVYTYQVNIYRGMIGR